MLEPGVRGGQEGGGGYGSGDAGGDGGNNGGGGKGDGGIGGDGGAVEVVCTRSASAVGNNSRPNFMRLRCSAVVSAGAVRLPYLACVGPLEV